MPDIADRIADIVLEDHIALLNENHRLREALKNIAAQLADHPDVTRGNSKVHYCYHVANAS